jgi:hypothetical protein
MKTFIEKPTGLEGPTPNKRQIILLLSLSKKGDFLDFSSIQHCFICRTSDSTVSKDAGFQLRTVAILSDALTELVPLFVQIYTTTKSFMQAL